MPQTTPAGRAAATIRGALRAQNLTHADLAQRLAISPGRASARLRGEYGFSLDEVAQIADWLDLDPTRLAAAIYAEPARTPHSA